VLADAVQAEAPMAVKGEGTLVLMIMIPWQGCFSFHLFINTSAGGIL
jgi:hypothetical protein